MYSCVWCGRKGENPETEIIPIDPEGRYILLVSSKMEEGGINSLRDVLAEWWESTHPFLVLGTGGHELTLERLEK